MDRPTWDSYFMQIAKVVASRATCHRAQVGGVVVDKEHHVLATGYNGAPSRMPHCPEDESREAQQHCQWSSHAEQNIVAHSARIGTALAGAIWYLWPFGPCKACQKLIIGSGAQRVITPQLYTEVSDLEAVGIEVICQTTR